MTSAKISVVIAARNEAIHLKTSLESVLAQTAILLELIFVDDNSTDETLSIAQAIAANHSNLVVYKNPQNGKCSAFNFGVAQATGDFICIFAGDDIMPPGSLSARYSSIKQFSPDALVVGLSKIKSFSENKRFDGILAPRRKGKGSLSGVSPLMSRAAARKIFPVPEHLPNEDTWMELAILYLPGIEMVHTDIICCFWRVHSGNSINMFVDYPTYNKKITIRMSALALFFKQNQSLLSPENVAKLGARVKCEEARKIGSILGILRSRAGILDRLRALSMLNAFFYRIRSSAFKAFSGWGY